MYIFSVLRSAGAIGAGIAVAFVLIIAVELASSIVHPFPPGVDPTDIDVCKAHVARYPAWVLALVVVAWGLTGAASSWVATRLGTGKHPAHGIFVGLILLAAAVFNMAMLPYPLWFWLNIIVIPTCFFWGAKQVR